MWDSNKLCFSILFSIYLQVKIPRMSIIHIRMPERNSFSYFVHHFSSGFILTSLVTLLLASTLSGCQSKASL
jgi:hypothetical protein